MRFVKDFWHPNVYKDGTVCISILHPPGEDKYGYEKPEERWLPVSSCSIASTEKQMTSFMHKDSYRGNDSIKCNFNAVQPE